jgi:hypothetical protein
VAALALLAGASAAGASQVTSPIDAEPVAVQSPVADAAATPDLAKALSNAKVWTGTATYSLRARSGERATVTVTRDGSRVRVDVAAGGLTSSVMTADAGWVACAASNRTTCVLVAAAGAALPAAWDPGVGRLLTDVVPGLADRAGGIYASGYMVAGAGLGAAACAEVIAPDTGRYCVSEEGLLRRAELTGGTLALTSHTGDADADRFTPPSKPTPLT